MSGCHFFETRIKNSLTKAETIYILDTATTFTKTVLTNTAVEKKVFSITEDSVLFFADLIENESFHLDKIILNPNTALNDSTLKKIGLEYDSVKVASNSNQHKATFYSTKKSPLYDIKKTYFITFDSKRIILKNIKIQQQLLHEESKDFEINYSYIY